MATTLVDLGFKADTSDLNKAQDALKKTGDATKAVVTEQDKLIEELRKSTAAMIDFSKQTDKVNGSLKDVAQSFNPLKLGTAALTAAISGLTLGALKGMVSGVIEGAAALNNMSKETGMTVESLSIMKSVAKASGTDMDLVTGAVIKFQKSIAASSKDTSLQAKAFKELGIDTSDTTKTTEEYLAVAADKLNGLADGWQKNNILMALFGKSGTKVNEFLGDYAERGTLAAKITTDQAEAAEHYERTMKQLEGTTNQYKQLIGMALLPVMSSIADEFLVMIKQTGKLDDASKQLITNNVQDWAFGIAKALGATIDVFSWFWDAVMGAAKAIGVLIGSVATFGTVMQKVLSGDFKGAWDLMKVNVGLLKDGMSDAWKTATTLSTKYYDTVMKAEANFTANKGKKSDGGKKLPTPGNIGGEPVPGSGGTDRSVAESDVTKALIEQDKSLLKLQADYKGLFDEETNLHTLQIQAEIDLRKFNAQYKTLKGEHILVKAAATDEQIAQLKLNAANEDALTLYIKLAKAQITADDAVKKASVTSRQEVEINRIRIDVLKSLTATQDDAKVAVAAYNVKEAESALATAQANGTSKEKIIGLKAEVEIMKAKAEAAKELAKDDATETSRKNYLNLDEAIKKSTISSRQEVETNRIRIEVMKKFGATQNDVNVAIAEYNVQEAEAAVATAKSTGQSQEKILALEAEAAAMKSKSEAAKSIKTDDDAEVQRQKTFEYGWKNAFDNYTKNADSAAQMTQKAFDSVTSHMSDSLTNFVMTGKLDFADLAKSILADLAKIMVQKAMAGMVGSLMGGLFANGGAFQGGTQFFADGGVVSQPTAFGMSGGRTGVMGEAGAEAIMPLARGANGKLGVVNSGGGGGGNVVNHINVSIGSVDSEAKKNEMLKAINESIIITSKKTIQNEMRQGGMLTRRIA